MNKFNVLARNQNRKHLVSKLNSILYNLSALRLSSGDSKENDGSNNSKTALNKLNVLLKQIVEDKGTSSNKDLNFARPTNQRAKGIELKSKKEATKQAGEQQILTAVKNVAEAVGGNVKQTESELLSKLLNPVKEEEVTNNLSDIVKGMKIDRATKTPEAISRAQQVRQLLENINKSKTKSDFVNAGERQKTYRRTGRRRAAIELESVDLFGGKPLDIFTSSEYTSKDTELKTWQRLQNREVKLAITHPPANYFQQMILWTKQGKMWKFPIDNEQDAGEEENVFFTEHVFLEQHLESWCPTKGPIRHFMELVCVGLSKNPYLTVREKKEHIDWFHTYFSDKKQLLQEVGALPADSDLTKLTSTGIES